MEKYLGIEFGSTRIKAVLIDGKYSVIASGAYDWQNSLVDGCWTYSQEEIIAGLQGSYAAMAADYRQRYGEPLTELSAMGISAMMHGYLAFDKDGKLLTPFRTWRNTFTGKAADELTELFEFNIPQRWSISHLYHAILNKEPHVPQIARLDTLAVYIHYLLTGRHEAGSGEAAGMFPISGADSYNAEMLEKFRQLVKPYGFGWDIAEILPEVKPAGSSGAVLTEAGAKLLDPSGGLKAGVPLCPPEGDAGTGMVATNSVKQGTGNVSAGTSIFSMVVLEKPLRGMYRDIDIVATPDGSAVAMVHCNNCCSELDAWVKVFGEFAELSGVKLDKSGLYEKLYRHAMTGAPDCGGVVAYNFLSGEPVAGTDSGRPMYFRSPDGEWSLANFMRAELNSAFAALAAGMEILTEKEQVTVAKLIGHGGLFKVPGAAQKLLANALSTEVSVMATAGEGGAWGMALLAAFMEQGSGLSLPEFLDKQVFSGMEVTTEVPDELGAAGFRRFIENWRSGLPAQRIY
ncbi:MAG: xylulokinase [Oscillospiraceae bacterium]